MQEESFEVQYTQEGERLDKVLSEIYPDFSRSFFQKLIKDKQIQVNGAVQKASYPVHTEDLIRVTIPDAVETTIEPENIPLDILYEDNDVLIVNKPKGMVVHPSAGHYSGTLVNAIMYHCKDSLSGINGQIRPGIVHRIDMDTTGSLIVCKNDESHVNIAEQIKEHTVNRIYVGIVCGNVTEDEGTIEGAIGRHPVDRKKMAVNEKNGKPAILDERHFFNLSHSGSYAACVYGTYPCGIDIQKHTPDRFHVAERCFTPLEQKKIREEGAQCFTRIWTVKESYLKYTGQGIRIPLNSIEVLPGRLQQKTDEDPASREILSEAETQIFSAESSSSPERSPLPVFVREFALNDYWLALTSPVRTGQPPVLLSIEELLSV